MTAFTLALLSTLFFGVNAARKAIYWADPRHVEQPIAGWMTPGYVGMSWSVPREIMRDALNLTDADRGPIRLQDLADQRSVPLSDIIAQINTAIAAHRASGQ
ncbi:hypothetical protein [Gymnodinialimonas sp. 57CJ19]|uniref:hypothetical protein n=1 Tax=Gymnodinialimonas sp. 57CJ19 TaxID=3138498 RepID=UPI003134466D